MSGYVATSGDHPLPEHKEARTWSGRVAAWVRGLDSGGRSGRDDRTATEGGLAMSSATIATTGLTVFHESHLAAAGFLARYSGSTRYSYSGDLRQFFAWCAQVNVGVFEVRRGHLEHGSTVPPDFGGGFNRCQLSAKPSTTTTSVGGPSTPGDRPDRCPGSCRYPGREPGSARPGSGSGIRTRPTHLRWPPRPAT